MSQQNSWRAMLQWLGGMGIIVWPLPYCPCWAWGMQLYRAEMNGINKTNKLATHRPNRQNHVGHLCVFHHRCGWLCILRACRGLMPLCHAMGSISLGGVTTHSDGLVFVSIRR